MKRFKSFVTEESRSDLPASSVGVNPGFWWRNDW